MFTAIALFLKNKLFSGSGMFILGFVAIIGMFLVYNSDTILEKFGFETKATLASKLTSSQKDLTTATDINRNLNKTIDTLQTVHQKEVETIVLVNKQKEKTQETVRVVTEKRKTSSKATQDELERKTITTDTTTTLPIAEYNQLSLDNISSIHDAFNQLGFQSELS
jgi:phenylalanyl-tRNA synthetase alpha subunit